VIYNALCKIHQNLFVLHLGYKQILFSSQHLEHRRPDPQTFEIFNRSSRLENILGIKSHVI